MSRNLVYNHKLFKTDVGGHSKTFDGNVNIPYSELEFSTEACGGWSSSRCSCGPPRSARSPAEDPTDVFVNNHCIGEPSKVDCVKDARSAAIIMENTYYWNMAAENGTEVCTNNASSPLERGSVNKPMPSAQEVVALAKATLGMA